MYRLCLAWGEPYIHPDILAEALTARQLDGWLDYAAIEPWGQPVEDYRAAIQAWASVMPHSGKSKVTIEQFLPQWEQPEPPSPEEYQRKAMRLRGVPTK